MNESQVDNKRNTTMKITVAARKKLGELQSKHYLSTHSSILLQDIVSLAVDRLYAEYTINPSVLCDPIE